MPKDKYSVSFNCRPKRADKVAHKALARHLKAMLAGSPLIDTITSVGIDCIEKAVKKPNKVDRSTIYCTLRPKPKNKSTSRRK